MSLQTFTHTPPVPGSVRVIGDLECRSRCKCQYYEYQYLRPPSVTALALPTWLLQPLLSSRNGTTHNVGLLEQHTAGLLRNPLARVALPQGPRTRHAPHASVHIAPARPKRGIKRAAGSRRRLG